MTEKFLMPKAGLTYGQLDKVLRSLGFTRHEFERRGKGVRYEHKETGARITMTLFPKKDRVLMHHFVMVRGTLNDFGVADPSVLEKKTKKAG